MSTLSSAMAKITKNYCAIYLVRHGETEWNAQGRIQGHTDSPLTATGEKQARDLAKKLTQIHFDAIFSSDLLRAQRTAQIVALNKKLAVTTSQALREVKFGQFEGKTGDEFRRELKDLLDQRDQLSGTDRFRFKLAPDIESNEELVSRLITFLREIAVAYLNKTVLMVSHGGPIQKLLIHLGFASYTELPHNSIDNTAYVKLESDGIDFFIRETFGIHKVVAK